MLIRRIMSLNILKVRLNGNRKTLVDVRSFLCDMLRLATLVETRIQRHGEPKYRLEGGPS